MVLLAVGGRRAEGGKDPGLWSTGNRRTWWKGMPAGRSRGVTGEKQGGAPSCLPVREPLREKGGVTDLGASAFCMLHL